MSKKKPRQPLRELVLESIRREIAGCCKVGDCLPPEASLSKRFGVSLITLREAVSILCHEGWLERKQGSGVYVLDRSRRQWVGILTTLDLAPARPPRHWMRMIQTFQERLWSQGYRCRVYLGRNQSADQRTAPPEFLSDVAEGRLCGVLAAATPPDSAWMKPLMEQHVPVVGGVSYAYGVDPGGQRSVVRMGVQHLHEIGCRRIALIGADSERTRPAGQPPLAGILEAELQAEGLPFFPAWCRTELRATQEGGGWEVFRDLWRARADKPDGLVVTDEVLFQDACLALLNMRIRVPEDLHVVAHASRGAAVSAPFPVARIESDSEAEALGMADLLIRLMRNEPPDQPRVVVECKLVTPYGHAEHAVGVATVADAAGATIEDGTLESIRGA